MKGGFAPENKNGVYHMDRHTGHMVLEFVCGDAGCWLHTKVAASHSFTLEAF